MPNIPKTVAVAALWLGVPAAPALADVHPYLSTSLASNFESVEPSFAGFAPFPLRSPGRIGSFGARGTLGLDGGLGLDLGPDTRLFGGLGLRTIAALPTQDIRLGSTAATSLSSLLPAGFKGTAGYAYRDDFAGYRGHDFMLAIERPMGSQASWYADSGWEWAGAGTTNYDGPFGDFGVRLPFEPLGATFLADASIARQTYLGLSQDLVGSFNVGVRKRLDGGYTLWAAGGPAWGISTTELRSFLAPQLSVGMSWTFDDVWASPPRPVKNPGMTSGPFAS